MRYDELVEKDGEFFRKRRRFRSISQFNMSEIVGVTQEAISMVETNYRRLRKDKLIKMARALGINIDEDKEKEEEKIEEEDKYTKFNIRLTSLKEQHGYL